MLNNSLGEINSSAMAASCRGCYRAAPFWFRLTETKMLFNRRFQEVNRVGWRT